jgi:hypothetical protein
MEWDILFMDRAATAYKFLKLLVILYASSHVPQDDRKE